MKNLNVLALVVTMSLFLFSCSNEESMLPEEENTSLLKSYKISKDAEGNYSLNFDLNDNGAVDKVVDKTSNSKNFYLYSSENQVSKKITEDLVIDGEQLQVSFVDTRSDKSPTVTIIDDDITFAKTNKKDFLKEYSIESNEEGDFLLDFTVNAGVVVDFSYNEEIDTYEVHLKEGKSQEKKFSKVLENEEGKPLKLDFVNYINVNAKNYESEYTYAFVKKPKIIIGTPDEDLF
jgi:hypothetical protein